MGTPRLSQTIKSLWEKRGRAKPRVVPPEETSSNEAAPSSTATTTAPVVPGGMTERTTASFSASATLTLSDNPTSAPLSTLSLADYSVGTYADIASHLSPDLRERVDRLRDYWGADSSDKVVDHIIYLCLHTNGDWRSQDVESLVRCYLDSVGLV